jgi:CIC family chloride channel protein
MMQTSTPAAARSKPVPSIGLVRLSLLAFVVGVVTGLGAVLFRDLIGLIHNVLFLGKFTVQYNANVFTPPSPWGIGVILVPVVGAVIVTFLISNFAPEARGHGVPEVMDAIYYGGGVIRPVVAAVKSVGSAFAIGSGSAVGREGPIIQIGSALGSTLGQIVRMSPGQRIILVAAGAGAGIAATFNTPIGGVMFTIELMMPEVSVASFLPVALSTAVATFVGRFFFGIAPAFYVPHLAPLSVDLGSALTLALYGSLGVLTGIAAAVFVRGLHLAEDLFDKIEGRYVRHVLGMLLVGVLIYLLQRGVGHYFVEGVGYATIQAILLGGLSGAGLSPYCSAAN